MGFINRTVLVHNGTLSVRIQIQIHGTDLLMDSSGIKAHFLRKKRLHKNGAFLTNKGTFVSYRLNGFGNRCNQRF